MKGFYKLQAYAEVGRIEHATPHQNLGGDGKLSDDSLPEEVGLGVGGRMWEVALKSISRSSCPLLFWEEH